jgi:signal transduction histidine kinase
LPHLFERFHRVRNEAARTHEGTGIGLALVRELVTLHGGEVSVESVLGSGTTFTITLPFGDAHLPTGQVDEHAGALDSTDVALAYMEEAGRWVGVDADVLPQPAPDGAALRARVVVVDDNADMRDYMVDLLARHWQVDAYPDGRAALEAVRANPPALVVTDVMMPHLDGFGLLEELRSAPETAPIPVIVVSARAGEESSVEGLDAGADDYLVKPFSARELVARVRTNLELARLRAEAGRLAAVEDVRSRVITTVSHELRTPVSAIFGASRTLDRDGLDEAARRQLLSVIASESERLARITNDVLTTESLAADLLRFELEPLDVRTYVERAAEAARAATPDGLGISVGLPDEPVVVSADPTRLQQVLTNLLDNAIKYSPDGGDVRVDVEEDDQAARIVVSDHGIGIPADARSEVFERFYRVDPDIAGGVGGLGLGLYLCRQIVQKLGGTVAAEANEPRGTRLVVSLPRVSARPRQDQ